MDYIVRDIPVNGRGYYDFGLTGDWHHDSAACAHEMLADTAVSFGKNCHGWIGLGDYSDAISRTDRRWDDRSLDKELLDEAGHKMGLYFEKSTDRLAKTWEPAAHNCLGLMRGNHEITMEARYDRDLLYRFVTDLQKSVGGKKNPYLQALDYEVALVLRFHRKAGENKSSSTVKMFLHHGAGAPATKGGQANKLLQMANILPEASVFVCGHYHREDTWFEYPMRLHICKDDVEPIEGRQLFIQVASFYRTYVKGTSTYASRRLYRPSGLGGRVLRIWPFRRFCRRVHGERMLDLLTPVIEPLWNVKDETVEVTDTELEA